MNIEELDSSISNENFLDNPSTRHRATTVRKTVKTVKTIERRETSSFLNKKHFIFGCDKNLEKYEAQLKLFPDNKISTTKYNLITWFPKSLLMQFKRVANIYFLLITILTWLPLSPKGYLSQTFTFCLVLFFTMIKEAYEDWKRYLQDKEINSKYTYVYNYETNIFEKKLWFEIRTGDLIKVYKDEHIPADIYILKSSFNSGLSFVDTKNLDGESNLKEKLVAPEFNDINENEIFHLNGNIQTDMPNAYMDSWEANIFLNNKGVINSNIKQLLLKGSTLKNTDSIIGLAVYTGHDTKIMKNAKDPPLKMSNVMKTMNILLISVFIFQIIICILFSSFNLMFRYVNDKYITLYISIGKEITIFSIFVKFFTFLVAYSHLIPISLYVSMEIVKILQSYFIYYDEAIFDNVTNLPSVARTSELIEELGQVEFVFSDKTGTLTQNIMEFKKCYIAGKFYGDMENDKNNNSFTINNDPSANRIMYSKDELSKREIINFFRVCTLCHSSIAEKNDGDFKYSSSSPDEIALIQGAKNMGFTFINRTTDTIEIMNSYTSTIESWELLVEIPFDSDRKRMTMIVKKKDDLDDTVLILTKGADNVMLPLLNIDKFAKDGIVDALYKFSCEGLRTLILSHRTMTYDSFKKWNEKYKNALVSSRKEELLPSIFNEIENYLLFSGVSAIEDKLQEGVPETIELLLKSDIRVWVLTGDKKETALNIGRTCRLIEEIGKNEINLTSVEDSYQNLKKTIERNLNLYINQFHLEHFKDMKDIKNLEMGENYYMIVDGMNLIEILKNKEFSNKFFKLGLICRSVIICRATPKQKSDVVSLAKSYGEWITLSIGDGANDVPMIMEAHIGVGVQGKEGTQAVRSADYAICQFKFIQRLILIHGRNGYRRISAFICYYFYKNIILVFAEIYFVFFSGFSGQPFFPDFLPVLYNAVWTSWPCIFAFSIEKDIPDDNKCRPRSNNLLGKYYEVIPILYKAGQIKYYFNMRVFWSWMITAIIHGGSSYLLVTLGMCNKSIFNDGKLVDHWWITTLIFSLIIHVVTYKIFIEISFWNKLVIFSSVLCILFYYVSIYMIGFPYIAMKIQNELVSKVNSMFNSGVFWLYILICPVFIVSSDIVLKFLYRSVWPTPSEMLQNIDIKEEENILKRISKIKEPKAIYLLYQQARKTVKNRLSTKIDEKNVELMLTQ